MMYGKYADKIVHIIICIFIHASFWVQNFMLPTCRLNFVKVAHTT